MTRDTVAGDRLRCSAKNFRLTDCAEAFPRCREDGTVFDRGKGCLVRVVWHKQAGGARAGSGFLSVQTS